MGEGKKGEHHNANTPNRNTRTMVESPARVAESRERANEAQRRAGSSAAGVAVGSCKQGVSLRDGEGKRFAGGPLPRALPAARLPLHVWSRLFGGLSLVLVDRGRLQRSRRASG